MEKQAPIPDEEVMAATQDEHKALELFSDPVKLKEFLRLTLIKHAVRDAAEGMTEGRGASAARKRFADIAGQLVQSEEE